MPWLLVARIAATLLAVAAMSLSCGAVASDAATPPVSRHGVAHWQEIGSYVVPTLTADQGLATVALPGGGTTLVYRGDASVLPSLAAQGWTHIGDPDSAAGYIIDAYQGASSTTSKLFLVTTPTGATIEYVHPLIHGELYNNSFDAISPDEQWMVSGTWGTISHLQEYPAPLLGRHSPPPGKPLPLAAFIALDHPVNDIQGCDFITSTSLICSSDDSSGRWFANQKPLLEVRLTRRLDGRPVQGHVVDLGAIPQVSACTGAFEAEGVDYDVATGILRVEIIQPGPCILSTNVLEYVHR